METALFLLSGGCFWRPKTEATFVKYQGGDLVKYKIVTGAQNEDHTGAGRAD